MNKHTICKHLFLVRAFPDKTKNTNLENKASYAGVHETHLMGTWNNVGTWNGLSNPGGVSDPTLVTSSVMLSLQVENTLPVPRLWKPPGQGRAFGSAPKKPLEILIINYARYSL